MSRGLGDVYKRQLLCIAMVNRVRYGPKDREFIERTKTGTIAMVLIVIGVVLFYIFS